MIDLPFHTEMMRQAVQLVIYFTTTIGIALSLIVGVRA